MRTERSEGARPAVRRLAADMVGYWRLMGVDAKGIHQRLKAHRPELIKRELKA